MLDLSVDAGTLTAALVDIESVSRTERVIADAVEQALRALPERPGRGHITVERDGNVVLARTDSGAARRVVLAGHLDTVPVADNLPARVDGDTLWGCGTSDMKSGLAVMLRAAHLVGTGALRPGVDLTWIAYDCEEIEAAHNGLGRIARERPDALAGDLAVLLEPTGGLVEGGCQGTLRVRLTLTGTRAHSARSWLGENAIHRAAPVLERLAAYRAREVEVEGLTYREGLNAVGIEGGVAGNVIPDSCTVTVNFRFAPERSEAEALDHVRSVFAGIEGLTLELTDSAPAARPGLTTDLAQALVAASGGSARAKLGWTDVARFGQLGVPALNFAPGDPNLAHKPEEHVSLAAVQAAEDVLVRFLTEAR